MTFICPPHSCRQPMVSSARSEKETLASACLESYPLALIQFNSYMTHAYFKREMFTGFWTCTQVVK